METMSNEVLDVTLLEPKLKHPTIFKWFDELQDGEQFTIHNDHDPKPLYYQLLGERGEIFSWEYIEEGPEWWKVTISKRLSGEADKTLGELAAADYRKAQVFKKFGLDFCCGGNKSLKQACSEKGVSYEEISNELKQSSSLKAGRELPYNEWNPGFLADYIVETHHGFVNKNMPDIRAYALKVSRVHGNGHHELLEIQQCVEDIHTELEAHMQKEERILFPYIKYMQEKSKTGDKLENSSFGSVQNPISMMEQEHEMAGELLAKIRELSNDYQLPEDACASYTLLYQMLEAFEDDLHLHIHLENNILFPKAVELEKELLAIK